MQDGRRGILRKLILESDQRLSDRLARLLHSAPPDALSQLYRCLALHIQILAVVARLLGPRPSHLIHRLLRRVVPRLLRPMLLLSLKDIASVHLLVPIFHCLKAAAVSHVIF